MRSRLALVAVAALCLGRAASLRAQALSGQVFEDLDADGIRDATESGIDNVPVTVFGATADASGSTAGGGAFSIATTPGCRGVFIDMPGEPDPATGLTGGAWRRIEADSRTCPGNATNPIGRLRYGVARHLRDNLQQSSLLYVQLGDSIAAGVSVCFFNDTDYSPEVAQELDCMGPGAVTVDNRAVGGWHSADLLTPQDGGSPNPQFIPNVVAAQPGLVTMSIGGNDFLDTEPATAAAMTWPYAAADLQRSFSQLVRTRRNIQEILSVLTTQIPDADVEINTVYDNLAGGCSTPDFHAAAPPMWNQMLRHAAWGQLRPAQVAEVAPEYAHQDVLRASCCGATGMICALDTIHPTAAGADIIQHALMESLGRVQVGAAGASGFDVGCVPLAAVLAPSSAAVVQGASAVSNVAAASALDGAGALVSAGGIVEVSGFALPADVVPTRVVVGVRYRTTAAFGDDTHLFDASIAGFAPPQYTFTGWDTVTPLVGGSGGAGNIGTPSVVNALPNVPAWRDVTAMLTKNATDDGRVTGYFTWPAPDAADIASLKLRLTVNQVGAADAARVEWDGAWAWVYGARGASATPGEVSPAGSATPLRVRRDAGYEITWGAEPVADTYRVWRGDIGYWSSASCNPGVAGGCVAAPALTWTERDPPDARPSWFVLVQAVTGSAEGTLGFDSSGEERTASVAACP